MLRLLAIVAALLLGAGHAAAQGRYFYDAVPAKPAASTPYGASDYLPLVRGSATYKVPGTALLSPGVNDRLTINGVVCSLAGSCSIVGGIDQLTGSVLAGPGTGPQAAVLAATQPDAHTWLEQQSYNTVYGAPPVGIAGTSYTLDPADSGKVTYFSAGSDITLTLPDDLPAGFSWAGIQLGTGKIVPTISGGAILTSVDSFAKSKGVGAQIGLYVVTNAGGNAARYIFSGNGAQ